MYTLVDGVEFYDKDEVDDIVRAITGGSLPNEDGIRNELTAKIEAEAAEREQADTRLGTELGTRIDEEITAREAATAANKSLIDTETQARAAVDTLLSNQLAAIEQLHTTLIGPNGFVDSDGDTVKANDSGKSIRQIANEEFYRQLITDADNVKTQLDTIKELADYLQQNPSIITDMYSKLGITWSIDDPTDFGTFDFSRVLTATNVDDAVLELYNTFTDKIGDLTQLTTTFKDSIVGAVNELDADIGNEVTARTDADTALGTRIDNEVTAREQADTALGTRIDTEIGTLSALTTTAKDNVVAAINELDADIGNEVTARTDADTALGTRIDTEIGTLSALTTAAKDNVVAAINELDADIGNEVTARTDADTALGTRIDTEVGTLSALTTTAKDNLVAAVNEVKALAEAGGGGGGGGGVDTSQLEAKLNDEIAARTQGDTALGTRIDTEVGALSSLTTTAKGSLVAAVNEVQSEVNGKQDSLVVKSYTMPPLTTPGTRFIKIATCPWATVATIRCYLYGDRTEDSIFINICGGNSQTANSCGWYTTNDKKTQAVIIKRGATYNTNFEVWLKVHQLTTLSVQLYAEKQYIGILNTDTHLNITDTAPSGSIAEQSLMAKHSGFFGSMPSASANDNTYRYTFVVDSNAALTAWANNDKASGQDYTSVLIRRGEWTSTKGVNLTTAGTKVVVGEVGSKLVFNGTEKGLYYDTSPNESDYYMQGVTVTVTVPSNSSFVTAIGFSSCINLTNCTGTVTGFGKGIGFSSCINLSNCTGSGTGTGRAPVGHITGTGFSSCTNLTNCTGSGTGTGLITNNGVNAGYGFSNCTNLSNCTGSGTVTARGDGFGFISCTNLTNCTGSGTGTGSSNGTGTGFGFYSCKVVIGCKAGGHCTTNAFDNCYASSSETSTYACADTANGGFNNTTNPAA